jgi:hypothetical protein
MLYRRYKSMHKEYARLLGEKRHIKKHVMNNFGHRTAKDKPVASSVSHVVAPRIVHTRATLQPIRDARVQPCNLATNP